MGQFALFCFTKETIKKIRGAGILAGPSLLCNYYGSPRQLQGETSVYSKVFKILIYIKV